MGLSLVGSLLYSFQTKIAGASVEAWRQKSDVASGIMGHMQGTLQRVQRSTGMSLQREAIRQWTRNMVHDRSSMVVRLEAQAQHQIAEREAQSRESGLVMLRRALASLV